MRRTKVILAVVTTVLVAGLICVGHWLWVTPLTAVLSKATIGKLDLEQNNAELKVRFVPLKNLSSITLLLPKPMPGSQEFCTHPNFPLSLHLRVTEADGTSVIDKVITRDQMQWTSWHTNGPSLLLMLDAWLGQPLQADREYDLSLSVDSAVPEVGRAEVFLHWLDGMYIWGRDEQKLQLTERSKESLPR